MEFIYKVHFMDIKGKDVPQESQHPLLIHLQKNAIHAQEALERALKEGRVREKDLSKLAFGLFLEEEYEQS